jgi:3-deoxy-7-phosphoheptulonate synthase
MSQDQPMHAGDSKSTDLDSLNLDNVNIVTNELLSTPQQVKLDFPLSLAAARTVRSARTAIEAILDGTDERRFVIVGPCAIHDVAAALEYAARLRTLAAQVQDELLLVMRVYFEKPRTTTGWKGLINDPALDDSFDIERGLRMARSLLLELNTMGVAVATEALDPIVPQYLADLIAWTAIGARTTESQTHREMSSGLSTPVGFKNGTDGNMQTAVNAVKAASVPHRFLGINSLGQCSVFHTRGNRYGHVVLRGGAQPNYDRASVAECARMLREAEMPTNIVVDCSHGNSQKNPERQPQVFAACIEQSIENPALVKGIMLESNLEWGRQELSGPKEKLRYGVSITDACIDWASTERLILEACGQLRQARASVCGVEVARA